MTSTTIESTFLSILLACVVLVEEAACSPVPSNELPVLRLSPRASNTKESRRDSSIIIAVSVIFGVFVIIYVSYKCCCASRPHGRNCASHPHQCNAYLAGHESCGQPSFAHDCTCGALKHNEAIQSRREARRNDGKGDTMAATVDEVELQAHNQNPDAAPPPYTPPVNDYGIREQRAPEPAVLRPNAEEYGDGIADGRQPSSAPEVTQSKNWGRWGS